MKKLLIITAITIMASTAWAQSQLLSVKGKTKDGKSINVQYYKGTAQDYIESVKYQLVDELKAENKTKQNNINELQTKLNQANKKIDQLNKQKGGSGNAEEINNLNNQLSEKESEINRLNEQLNNLKAQLNEAQDENAWLRKQLDSIKEANRQLSLNKKRSAKHPVIGVEANMGSVFLSKSNLNNPWEKMLSWNKQVDVYYGTGRLTESLPISLEAGVGFRSLPMKAKIEKTDSYLTHDCAGDEYRPIFKDCNETLTMNCLEVPVRLCLGQPDKSKVSVYTKLGVTPSYVFSSNLANSAYTKQGYYPEWNVTFEDIPELDFGSMPETNNKVAGKKFNLWGNAAFGAYVPLSSSLLFNVGAKLDYPIMSLSEFKSESSKLPFDNDLTHYYGRMLIPNLQVGFVYAVK